MVDAPRPNVPVTHADEAEHRRLLAQRANAAAILAGVNTFTATQIWSKGADIASASPLVLGADGNYFDVTGTTGFSAITVAAGTLFMLQFDGALILTDGASLTLPGNANITTAAGDVLVGFATAADTVQVLSYMRALQQPGTHVVQVVNTTDGAAATTTTLIPNDDTIPQNTEGAEFMTLAITPKATTNKLIIDVTWIGTAGTTSSLTVALFQDSTAAALAAATTNITSGAEPDTVAFRHIMDAGTVSATTLKVRAGIGAAGTVTFNGASSLRRAGGVLASSIVIREYAA